MSLSDNSLLATDPAFLRRVQSSMIAVSEAISSDGLSTGIAIKRHAQVQQIMLAPQNWSPLFAQAIASTDPTIQSQATNNGTLVINQANLSTQAALVQDAAINNACSAVFNSFFGGQ